MKKTPTVLVVEFYPYHTHNFPVYSQLLPSLFNCKALSFFYYVSPRVMNTLAYPEKKYLFKLFPSVSWENFVFKYWLRTLYFQLFINLVCLIKKVDCLIINTLESDSDKRIFKAIKAKYKIGIVHNPGSVKLDRERNALYLCMNEYVFEEMKEAGSLDGYLLSYFKQVEIQGEALRDEFVIGIPGGVSFHRRDYNFLFEISAELRRANSQKKIIFNIIGNCREKDGPELQNQINIRGLNEYFRMHEQLNDVDFSKEIYECDLLMPLVGIKNKQYLSVKNTATLSHSARYLKPLLLSQGEMESWGIPENCCYVYKDGSDLVSLVLGIGNENESMINSYKMYLEDKILRNKAWLKKLGYRNHLSFGS